MSRRLNDAQSRPPEAGTKQALRLHFVANRSPLRSRPGQSAASEISRHSDGRQATSTRTQRVSGTTGPNDKVPPIAEVFQIRRASGRIKVLATRKVSRPSL